MYPETETYMPTLRSNIMSILTDQPMSREDIRQQLKTMKEYTPINLTRHLFLMRDDRYPIANTYSKETGKYSWFLQDYQPPKEQP